MKQKISEYLDSHRDELAQFLSDMVKTPSLNEGTPDTCDEREMAALVERTFADSGLETSVIAVDKDQIRPNVFGVFKGAGGGRNILFNAHMDTVPITDEEKWKYPPLSGTIADGKVHGRGACDDKQGIAAMFYAVKALQAAGAKLKGDVILLASAGEESCEGGVYGPGPAIKESGLTAQFAVVCEGSSMNVFTASSSLCFFELVVEGKAIHVSSRNQAVFPQPYQVRSGSEVGVDALEKALPIIQMLYRKEKDWNTNTMRSDSVGAGGYPVPDKAGVGAFTINPCKIEGGTYLGSMPGIVKITYSIWHDNRIPLKDIQAEIERDVQAVASTDSWLREHPPVINMPILQTWPGYRIDRDHPGVAQVAKSYEEVTGRQIIYSGLKAVDDATYISQQGIPSVTLGPGGIDNGVHGTDEYCGVDELVEAAKVYAYLMLDWCE